MCQYSFNPLPNTDSALPVADFTAFEAGDVESFHQSIPGYAPTPLISLPGLARKLGVGQIWVKDEAHRFGLKAFKGLGASYAIYRFIKQCWEQQFGVQFETANLYQPELLKPLNLPVFCTATDGNHGRAVAWFSRLIGHQAVIYMPNNTVPARIDNIREEKAAVVVVDGDYDEAVRLAARDAEQNGWQVISDTSYPGYTQIPRWIMAGYTTMFEEINREHDSGDAAAFDVVLLQSGVGSFTAAAAWYYGRRLGSDRPQLISVEPTDADCLLESIKYGHGEIKSTRGHLRSIMAGLNCGTPSLVAWPLIARGMDCFISIADRYAETAMRRYYYPEPGDRQLVSGESGSAGLAGLIALLNDENLAGARQKLRLNRQSRILLFNTEGDTDPDNFSKVTKRQ